MQDQPTERLWEVHRGGIFFGDLGVGLKTKQFWSRQLTWHSIGTPARMTKLESHEWKLFFTSILGNDGFDGSADVRSSRIFMDFLCDSSVESVLKSKQQLNTKSQSSIDHFTKRKETKDAARFAMSMSSHDPVTAEDGTVFRDVHIFLPAPGTGFSDRTSAWFSTATATATSWSDSLRPRQFCRRWTKEDGRSPEKTAGERLKQNSFAENAVYNISRSTIFSQKNHGKFVISLSYVLWNHRVFMASFGVY